MPKETQIKMTPMRAPAGRQDRDRKGSTLAVVVRAVIATAVIATGLIAAPLGSASPDKRTTPSHFGLKAPRGGAPGGIAGDGDIYGTIINLTPYTLTLISAQAENDPQNRDAALKTPLPATLQPGAVFGQYIVAPFAGSGGLSTDWQYDMKFVYRAQTPTGPEDLGIRFYGCECRYFLDPNSSTHLHIDVYNSKSTNPEIGWTRSDDINSDVQFQVHGHFNIDAAKDPPALVDVINSLCAGEAETSCSFTATGPLTWGVGDPVKKADVANCTVPAGGRSRSPGLSGSDPPPPQDPNWHRVTVKASRVGSLTIGGSLTAATEFKVFDIVGAEVSAKFGAEHEWSDRKEFEKTTIVYVPSNYIAAVWLVPVVGKVTGTLVASNALASYTITNFGQVQSGASRDLMTPAFNVITTSRPMTATEYQNRCVNQARRHRAAARSEQAAARRQQVAARLHRTHQGREGL